MPSVIILCRPLTADKKQNLSQALTALFSEELNCKPEVVRIRFQEFNSEQYAVGGKLLRHLFDEHSNAVAVSEVHIGLYAGRSATTIEKVAERVTQAIHDILNVDAATVEINFHEMHQGNYFEGGKRAGPKQELT